MPAPLTETTFLILLSLRSGPRHGYAIMKDVLSLSEKRITLSTGTLYGAIKRLLDQAWIIRLDDAAEADFAGMVDGRGQKVYRLTDLGRLVLDAEIERLDLLVRKARLLPAEKMP